MLDEWFSEQIQPLLKGKSFIVRWADDFIMGFTVESDAQRVMEVLPKRFAKHELILHPEKTELIDLNSKRGGSGRSFDFRGFIHYLGNSRKGYKVLKRKTSSKSMTKAVVRFNEFIKRNRHMKLNELIAAINEKLRGHYSYYGYTFNFDGIVRLYRTVQRILYKWLNRRGGKPVLKWDIFSKLINQWNPLLKPFILHSFAST